MPFLVGNKYENKHYDCNLRLQLNAIQARNKQDCNDGDGYLCGSNAGEVSFASEKKEGSG